ncbi:MAG: MFS transporter [Pseudomonadota bacterium]
MVIHISSAARKVSSSSLSPVQVVGYGVGSIGSSVMATAPALLLLYYMTDVLGIEPGYATFGIFLPRLLDFATDPLMGAISDRTRSKWGPRRPYLLIGGLLSLVFTSCLFAVPAYSSKLTALIHVVGAYTLMVIAGTIFTVPYTSMPADIASSENDRTKMISVRLIFVMVGILLSGAVAQPIVALAGGGREGFIAFSLILGILTGGAMLVAFAATSKMSDMNVRPNFSILDQFRMIRRSKQFRALAPAYLLQIIGAGCALGAWPYFAEYIIDSGVSVSLMFLIIISTSMLSLPIWRYIMTRIGRKASYCASAALYIASVGAMGGSAMGSDAPAFLFAAFIGMGFANGGLQFVPFAVLADISQHTSTQENCTTAGGFTGIWFAVEKLGFALGPLLLGLVLSATEFRASTPNTQVVQSEISLVGILIAATAIPAVLIAASAWVVASSNALQVLFNSIEAHDDNPACKTSTFIEKEVNS